MICEITGIEVNQVQQNQVCDITGIELKGE